jgi:hypothetical protein
MSISKIITHINFDAAPLMHAAFLYQGDSALPLSKPAHRGLPYFRTSDHNLREIATFEYIRRKFDE